MSTVMTPEMTPAEKQEVMRLQIMENKIEAMVGQELEKHYDGWQWFVECRLPTGLVAISNLTLDGEFAYYLPIAALINETDPRLVMRAGGEILERYHQKTSSRSKSLDIERNAVTGAAIGDTGDATDGTS